VQYQEIRLQELPDQVPMGHIPRSMVVHCRGETTRLCTPGDIVTIAGIFLPVRYQVRLERGAGGGGGGGRGGGGGGGGG
jgi:DNA replicative helicase MCM subunit Mcm2 (Cdc46/Mcm family)